MKKKILARTTLLLGSCIFWLTGSAQIQTVTLTTGKNIGEPLTLVVNPRAAVSVDWGDGNAVKVTADTITGTLTSQTVTITGGKYWETLVCEGQELTQLELRQTTNLKNIYCQDNQLTAISLTSCMALERLNCSNNQLKNLSFSMRNANLEYLNCSKNELTTLSITSLKKLKTLICDNNLITSLNTSTSSDLRTIWCENNAIKSLYLTNNKAIYSLMCADNQITNISLAPNIPALTELWCENNSIDRLALSGSSLKMLDCSNNGLSSIEYPSYVSSTNNMYAVFCDYNNLNFNNMIPRSYVADHFVYGPQNNFNLPVEAINIDETLDLSEYNNTPYMNRITTYTWYSYDGTPLKKGSKTSGADYQVSLGKTTFYTQQKGGTYCVLTSSKYPDLAIRSSWLIVKDPSDPNAIGTVQADNGLKYQYNGTSLNVQADQPTKVTIYTVSGMMVWDGTVDQNGTNIPLKKGIYLLNGKRIIL